MTPYRERAPSLSLSASLRYISRLSLSVSLSDIYLSQIYISICTLSLYLEYLYLHSLYISTISISLYRSRSLSLSRDLDLSIGRPYRSPCVVPFHSDSKPGSNKNEMEKSIMLVGEPSDRGLSSSVRRALVHSACSMLQPKCRTIDPTCPDGCSPQSVPGPYAHPRR